MLNRGILVFTLPVMLLAQSGPALLTKNPNPVSANRPEVNSGYAVKIPVLSRPPAINSSGNLSDWTQAYRVENALMPFSPTDKGEPTIRGNVYLAWGKDGLYVAVEVLTNPKEIMSSLQGRDRDQTGQDQISVQMDPQGTGNSMVLLSVNPSNVQIDASYVEGGMIDSGFDMIWQSGAAITPSGWVAKIKIPFSSLRRSPQDWNLAVALAATRGGVTYTLQYPQGYLDVQCNVCQSVRIAGAPVNNTANVLMVVPHLYQERIGSLAKGTIHDPSLVNKNGVDLRYQATAYSLEGTYKPDFATIESDVNPLYINNRYKYLYPDKRPFFMNGMDVFGDFAGSALNILATRSIIAPDYGIKGSGQIGKASWNLMQAKDMSGGDSISTNGIAKVPGRATSDVAFGTSLGFGKGLTSSKLSLAATDREILGGDVDGADGPEHGFSRSVGLSLYQQMGQHWNATIQGVESYATLPSTLGGTSRRPGRELTSL